MKKYIVGIGLLFATLSFVPSESVRDVYICNGKYSKKFHLTKNCRGLSNCSTQVETVKLERAQELGRTLCGWED